MSIWAADRPRAALGLWLALIAALAVLGHGVGDRLKPTSARIDGSASATAGALTAQHFADSASLPVLLTGPSRPVRSQGKALAARLDRVPGVSVLSPWNDAAHRELLRPRADQVLILASVAGSERLQQRRSEAVRRLARAGVSGPVAVHVTGVPLVARDLRTASIDAAKKADLIALPLLLVLLLVVFRSLAAAAIPVAFGGATVLASGGVIRLLTEVTDVDAFATGLASMMGLALAVDYSLLIVSRFRDERAAGAGVDDAIATATRTSAHAVAVAGAAVVVAMGLAAALAAGQAVSSAALGVAAAGLLAMAGAALALPAILRLGAARLAPAAPKPEKAQTGEADPGLGGVGGVAAAVLRRPVLAAGVTGAVLVALAIPALHPDPSAPDVGQLPASSPARADYQAISAAVGPGWGAGFDLVSVARSGTMTTPKRLAALERLQRRIERDPGVAVVLGPGPLAKEAARLRRSGRDLLKSQKALQAAIPKQQGQIRRLGSQVGTASSGTKQLSGAFDTAESSANRLSRGGDDLRSGVGRLRGGIASAATGARKLDRSVSSATANTGVLKGTVKSSRETAQSLARRLSEIGRGEAKAPPVVRELQSHDTAAVDAIKGVRSASATQRQDTLTQIRNARNALLTQRQTVGTIAALAALDKAKSLLQSDPTSPLGDVSTQLEADARTAGGLAAGLSGVSFNEVARKARALSSILKLAESQQGNLDKGIAALTGSIGTLRTALEKLGGGSDALSGGLKALDEGIATLRGGAKEGKSQTAQLARGLEGARRALAGVKETGGGKGKDDTATAGGAIASGYFVLAALDAQGAGGATTGLDVERGGQAARIVVIPRTGPNDPRTRALADRLARLARDFSAAAGVESAVGGPAQVLADYQQATGDRLLTIVLALALATALLLAVVLRSALVAALGVALGLLAVGATLGIMDHLFVGEDPLLGGPGRLDATALTAVFAVMFALATDYQVFVVTRIREEVAAGRTARDAVAAGLTRTARVVTGAALSMVAVFLAFATADVASLQQFGVGLAVAVALDATLIRLVLLPAMLALCGDAAWWPGMPGPRGPRARATAA